MQARCTLSLKKTHHQRYEVAIIQADACHQNKIADVMGEVGKAGMHIPTLARVPESGHAWHHHDNPDTFGQMDAVSSTSLEQILQNSSWLLEVPSHLGFSSFHSDAHVLTVDGCMDWINFNDPKSKIVVWSSHKKKTPPPNTAQEKKKKQPKQKKEKTTETKKRKKGNTTTEQQEIQPGRRRETYRVTPSLKTPMRTASARRAGLP